MSALTVFKALTVRNFVYLKRTGVEVFSIIFWPMIIMSSLAFFATFIQSKEGLIILITGSIAWSYMFTSHVDTSYTFVRDMWHRSLKKLRILPVPDWQLIVGNWLFGLFRSAAMIVFTSTIAFFAFGFNLFSINLLYLFAVFFGLSLFGMGIGIIISSAILRYGVNAEVLIWSVADALIILSGVFFPVSVLPPVLQLVSYGLPPTYGLEGLRGAFLHGAYDWVMIGKFYLADLIYIGIFWIIFKLQMKHSLRTGFFQKYE